MNLLVKAMQYSMVYDNGSYLQDNYVITSYGDYKAELFDTIYGSSPPLTGSEKRTYSDWEDACANLSTKELIEFTCKSDPNGFKSMRSPVVIFMYNHSRMDMVDFILFWKPKKIKDMDKDNMYPIHHAIVKNDIHGVKRFISSPFDLKHFCSLSVSCCPLIHAIVKKNSYGILKLLSQPIDLRDSFNYFDPSKPRPNGDNKKYIWEYVFELKDVNLLNFFFDLCPNLFTSSSFAHVFDKVVTNPWAFKQLVDRDCFSTVDNDGHTLLTAAIRSGCSFIVVTILNSLSTHSEEKRIAYKNLVDKKNCRPLHHSIICGNIDIFKLLYQDSEVDINVLGGFDFTFGMVVNYPIDFYACCVNKDVSIIRFLVDQGFEFSYIALNGRLSVLNNSTRDLTIVDILIQRNSCAILQELIMRTDINFVYVPGTTKTYVEYYHTGGFVTGRDNTLHLLAAYTVDPQRYVASSNIANGIVLQRYYMLFVVFDLYINGCVLVKNSVLSRVFNMLEKVPFDIRVIVFKSLSGFNGRSFIRQNYLDMSTVFQRIQRTPTSPFFLQDKDHTDNGQLYHIDLFPTKSFPNKPEKTIVNVYVPLIGAMTDPHMVVIPHANRYNSGGNTLHRHEIMERHRKSNKHCDSRLGIKEVVIRKKTTQTIGPGLYEIRDNFKEHYELDKTTRRPLVNYAFPYHNVNSNGFIDPDTFKKSNIHKFPLTTKPILWNEKNIMSYYQKNNCGATFGKHISNYLY